MQVVSRAPLNILLERVETPLSIMDRLKFAAIGAVCGVVVGAALFFVAIFAFALPINPTDLVLFSALYFAVVGLIMGAFVGDFVGASIGGLLMLLAIDSHTNPQLVNERTFRPLWIGFAFVLWLVAAWFLYLRR